MHKGSTLQTASQTDHKSDKAAPTQRPTGPEAFLSDEEINKIVTQLLAQGLSPEEIVMPGSGADKIIFIADDFDAPAAN